MKKLYILNLIFILLSISSFSQQISSGSIKGTVITADNKPAEGVTVMLGNSVRYALADNKGNFELKNIEPGTHTLIISLIGHKDAEMNVTVEPGKQSEATITLELQNRELNEVIVTSRSSFKTNRTSSSLRLQTPILEIPQNIQVVTGKLINNQQIFDMLEGVTRNVSGASRVEHWDNYARITMRGSNVGAFRNGINVSTAWGPLTEDMSMVDRIEFVKGPAGFMLANGDPSGFYNVVTKKPTGRNKGEASLSFGSFDFYRATADIDGKFNKEGKLLYRMNVMGQVKGSHREFDYNNRYTIAPVLKYLVDDKTSLTLEYTHQFSEVNVIGSNYLFSKRGYADLPRNATQAESNLEPTKMNDRSIFAIIEHKMNNNWKFTGQVAYFNYQQEGASVWPWGFDAVNDSLIQRGISIWDVIGVSKMGQMYVNGEVVTGNISHKILGGLDMSNKDYYHDWNQGAPLGGPDFNIYNPVYGNATPPVFDRSRSIKERGVRYFDGYTGIYLQDELGFFNNTLRITLAGRFTTLKTGDVYNGTYKNQKFTPRLGLSYSIDKNTAVYFVKDESFLENYGSDWQGKTFDPISGENIEAGIKKDWSNGKWNSAISVYEITRNNVLTADLEHPNPSGGYFNRQSGQQKTKGVEVDVKGQIVPGLDVILNYAFTEAKVTKDSDKSIIGAQVPGSSKHIQNAWLNYRIERGKFAGLGVSAGYQFQADRSPWFVATAQADKLPDYFRLDGSISYQKEKIGFNLVVNNILNKYLYSGAPYGDFYYWQAEAGTNARFSVSYKF